MIKHIKRPEDPFEAAVVFFHSNQAELARQIGYSNSMLSYWKRHHYIPKRAKLAIEAATSGQVTAAQLDEVYPDRPLLQ